MKKLILKISKKFLHSVILRTILKPIVDLKAIIDEKQFQKSQDAEFIRSFHNIHAGERCFIIGNGPSLTGHDLDMIQGNISFACNRIYNIYNSTVWRPTYYMCSDRQCLMDEINNIKKLKGSVKFVATRAAKYGRVSEDELHYFLVAGPLSPKIAEQTLHNISTDVSKKFSKVQTITANEIEFAIYMGFKEIILLGVDHNYPIKIDKNGKRQIDDSIKSHFAGGGSKEKSLHYIYYDAATECYRTIEAYAKEHDIKIYNASRSTKLDVFEEKSLESLI